MKKLPFDFESFDQLYFVTAPESVLGALGVASAFELAAAIVALDLLELA